jgi:hypothetical protein
MSDSQISELNEKIKELNIINKKYEQEVNELYKEVVVDDKVSNLLYNREYEIIKRILYKYFLIMDFNPELIRSNIFDEIIRVYETKRRSYVTLDIPGPMKFVFDGEYSYIQYDG